jgi:hypothetical protein
MNFDKLYIQLRNDIADYEKEERNAVGCFDKEYFKQMRETAEEFYKTLKIRMER